MTVNSSASSRYRFVAGLAAVLAMLLAFQAKSGARDTSGNVYVMSNDASHNSVIVFHRNDDGTLTLGGSYSTRGQGLGSGVNPLGSQGALVLSSDRRLLFAVNAGSNDITVFGTIADRLQFLERVPSRGTKPISITVHGDLVYVLNAGGTPNIVGFRLEPRLNLLRYLPGSTRSLAGGSGAGPAQVGFSPDGSFLMVTEKSTNSIDTYLVGDDGYATGPVSSASSGGTPFGFQFARNSEPIVSEAAGGPGGTSAVSSYRIDESGMLTAITPSLGDTQKAACWLVVTDDGAYAFATNAGSGTISSYTVSPSGMLALLNATAGSVSTGASPIDTALSTGSHYLYTLDDGNGMVSAFQVGSGGSLTPLGDVGGVPSGAQGIAVR